MVLGRATAIAPHKRDVVRGESSCAWNSFLSSTLSVVACVVQLLLCSASVNAQTQDPVPPNVSQADLIETAIAGLKENDERLGMVEAVVHSVSENPDVKREEHVKLEDPDGTTVKFWRRPRSESRQKITVFGEKLRVEFLRDEGKPTATVRNSDVWTRVNPITLNAWVNYTDQMGSTNSQDPRDRVAIFRPLRLTDLLQQDQIMEAKLTDQNPELGDEHHGKGKLLARITTQHGRGVETVCLLDPKVNFLPVFSFSRTPGRKQLGSVVSNEYQHIPERSAWFLERSIRLFYKEEANAYQFGDPGWTRRSINNVASYRLLQPSENEGLFVVEFPNGTDVRDSVSHVRYIAGDGESPLQRDHGSIWLWVVLGAVVLIVLAIGVRVAMPNTHATLLRNG